jgi:hypothetical protein
LGTSTPSRRPTTYLIRHRDGHRDEYVDVDPDLRGLKLAPTVSRTTTIGSPALRRVITTSISTCPAVNLLEPNGEQRSP